LKFLIDMPVTPDAAPHLRAAGHDAIHAVDRRIIAGCRLAATALGCTLLEVEQLWAGTEIAERNGPLRSARSSALRAPRC